MYAVVQKHDCPCRAFNCAVVITFVNIIVHCTRHSFPMSHSRFSVAFIHGPNPDPTSYHDPAPSSYHLSANVYAHCRLKISEGHCADHCLARCNTAIILATKTLYDKDLSGAPSALTSVVSGRLNVSESRTINTTAGCSAKCYFCLEAAQLKENPCR